MAGNYDEPNQQMSFDEIFDEAMLSDDDKPNGMPFNYWVKDLLFDDSNEQHFLNIMQMQGESSLSSRSRLYIDRDRKAGHQRLFSDYFAPNPVHAEATFRRRFRMRRHVFLCIVENLSNIDPYFTQRVNAAGKKGLSPLQKCTVAIRMLAYGVSADAVDDYVRIGESIVIECLEKFVEDVIKVFENEYLRRPNSNDIQRLLHMGQDRDFLGMLGSIDCMHWQWKNCPKALKGMYMGRHSGIPTIVLEVVASSDLWIWHAFFGVIGSNNDINVLDRSPLFDEVLNGRAPEVQYTVNGTNYTMGYYLADGIYPEWPTYVKTISRPQGDKRELFAQYQEGQRKDVEQAFGVLQARFAIIRGPT